MAAAPSALPAVVGGSPGRDTRTGRNVDVYRHFDINRRTTFDHDPFVNRDTNLDRNLNRNLDLNRGIGTTFVLKPYRPWVQQSYYGKVVSGVTLGTIVGVTSTPVPPSTKVCWFWATSSHTQGYWDLCR